MYSPIIYTNITECKVKIEPKIFDELKRVLVSFGDKYFVGEELNRSKLSDDLRNYDEALLGKLFQIDFIKQHFIKEVAGQKLFQIEQLEEAILYNDYWDTSYTKYENRIGLASNGKFLEDGQDIVLDFPFKDGVLTASMTKEDTEDGYEDAFLNEVIDALGLTEIYTVHGRAEDLARMPEYREQFDLCVSRAVANLSTLAEYCLPFVRLGGKFISYKSGECENEVAAAKSAIFLLGGKVEDVYKFSIGEAQRAFISLTKANGTSKKYPRKAGMPSKNPL